MTQTHKIEWTTAKGHQMRMLLEQEGETFSDDKFPVSGVSHIRWSLSDQGFGGLNQEMTITIVDEKNDTFWNIFSNSRRENVRVKIESDDNLLFLGYPDYEQIAKLPYRDAKREISVKLYNPISYKVQMSRRQANKVYSFTQSPEEDLSGMNRVHQFLRSLMSEYGETVLYSHRWRQWESTSESGSDSEPGVAYQFNDTDDTCYLIFNQMWIDLDTVPVEEKYTGWIDRLSKAFWFRYGWSFIHQKPFVCQVDIGRVADPAGSYPYIVLEALKDVVGGMGVGVNDTSETNSEMGDFTNETFYRFLPSIDENKIVENRREPREYLNDPLAEVTYSDLDVTHTEENTEADMLSDSYKSESPLDPSLFDDLTNHEGAVAVLWDRSHFQTPPDPEVDFRAPKFFADVYFYTFMNQDIENRKLRQAHLHGSETMDDEWTAPELGAKLHMLIRESVRRKYEFDYIDYLDPLINYVHDGNVICLYEGDYDIISGETRVRKSMSLFPANH